jgi:hypothetical protein
MYFQWIRRKKMSRSFYIAGVQFRPQSSQNLIKELEEGDELTLKLEPTNQYDPNAVMIVSGDEHLGYVPKKFSAEISAMIEVDGPDSVQCVVIKVDPNGKKWEMCEVDVSSIEGTDEEELEDEYPEELDLDE